VTEQNIETLPGVYRVRWRDPFFDRISAVVGPGRELGRLYQIIMSVRPAPVVFDYYFVGDIPDNQRNFVDGEFTPLVQEMLFNEKQLGKRYLRDLMSYAKQIFDEGAVLNPANPENAARKLPDLRKRMEQCLLMRQRERANSSAVAAILLAFVLFVVGYYVGAQNNHTLEANLIYVAAASILADAFLMRSAVIAENMLEYEQKKYLLDNPFIRILLLAAAVELFAVLVWQGGLQLKIGLIDVQKLDREPIVAIVVGAAGGFLGSDLLKLLVKTFRRAVGRDPNSPPVAREPAQTQTGRSASRPRQAAQGQPGRVQPPRGRQ
jgi:hypothetical protein